jgi:DnaJ-domain-containing protein 1
MGKDFINKLLEMEKILQELRASGLDSIDDLIRSSFDPANWLRRMAEMGIDSQIPNAKQSGNTDPYQVLSLEKTATEEEVKKRYLDLVRVVHPDTATVKGTERLCQFVNEAYRQILKERGWR